MHWSLVPDTRTWLRRRLGLEPEDRRWFEEEGVELAEYEGDEPLDTREARFSLRARLSEDGPAEPVAPVAPEPFEVPAEPEPAVAEATPAPEPFPAATTAGVRAGAGAVRCAGDPGARTVRGDDDTRALRSARRPGAAGRRPIPRPRLRSGPPPSPRPRSRPSRRRSRRRSATPRTRPTRAVPSIVPEADAPKTPGEDTDEVGPLPPVSSWEPPVAPPPPPPTELRPPLNPPSRPFPSRPFSSEGGASFRSAIDAARERVHGAAREATPDEGDDGSEPNDENA